MHRAITLSILALAANTALVAGLTVNGFNFPGDSHAQSVCRGQSTGSMKCLTDVSYVICTNGNEKEQFVAAGTRCEQNGAADAGKLVAGAPSTTHVFVQSLATASSASVGAPSSAASSAASVATSAAGSVISAASSAVSSVATPSASASASASASSSASPTASVAASSVSSAAPIPTSQVFSIADAIASQVNSVLKTLSGLSFTPPASASSPAASSAPPASSATPMNSVVVTSPSIATALATASATGKKRDLASEEGRLRQLEEILASKGYDALSYEQKVALLGDDWV